MKVGIIGHGADKFTSDAEEEAKARIFFLLTQHPNTTLVSGHSPVGGIDIWAEEIADSLQIPKDIKTPLQHKWDAPYGYKARNLDIARSSDLLYVILVATYPPGYKGQQFKFCYHCLSYSHVKSGACWTAKKFEEIHHRSRNEIIITRS